MWRICLLIAFCSLSANSQTIYKVVSKDGTVTYTDKPMPGAEAVTLGPDNRMVSPKPIKPIETLKSTPDAKDRPPIKIAVITPADEATVRNNAGDVSFAANITGADKEGRFQLFIDDELASEQSKPVFHVSGLNRGAHTFYITHTDKSGKSLASSSPRTFYLHQASRLIN